MSKVKRFERILIASSATWNAGVLQIVTPTHNLVTGDLVTVSSPATVEILLDKPITVINPTTFTLSSPVNLDLQNQVSVAVKYYSSGVTGDQSPVTLNRSSSIPAVMQSYTVGTGGASYWIDASLDGIHWTRDLLVSHSVVSGETQAATIVPAWMYIRVSIVSIGASTKLYINLGHRIMAIQRVLDNSGGLPFQFFLTPSGNGLGTKNLIGNYTTPTDFYYEATSRFDIVSVLVAISDGTNFLQNTYGNLPQLTNGIKLYLRIGGQEIAVFDNWIGKTNYDWVSITPNVSMQTFTGDGQTLSANFSPVREYGVPLRLEVGDRFIIRLQDNFTGLILHTFNLTGTLYV